jgi:hypothetical protein
MHVAARKPLYEKLHPETKQGKAPAKRSGKGGKLKKSHLEILVSASNTLKSLSHESAPPRASALADRPAKSPRRPRLSLAQSLSAAARYPTSLARPRAPRAPPKPPRSRAPPSRAKPPCHARTPHVCHA